MDLKCYILSIFILCLLTGSVTALHHHTGAHDPTGIQKCGDTYWIYTTGNGIYSMYSRDMVSWTAGQTPYSREVYPSWINDYVPGFEGHFWAPECVYMNGKYHLYYSCSTWGSKSSCIGLVTSRSLNPRDPDYLWEDQGVVVFSNAGSDANCIDPSVFRNQEGQYYLTYGSYFGGIRIVEIDSTSGKVSGSYRYPVASGNCEASYVIPHEGYYYLFINRGTCCQGIQSTYYIQVGKSASPTGPFLDKEGTDLNSGGGSTILSTSGNFIGPGHVGYYREAGEEWVTYHYYDGDRNGAPTLAIGTMRWEEGGWPRITNEFLEEGNYLLVNHNSQLVCQTEADYSPGSPVTQGSYVHVPHQQWSLIPVGNGYYSISPGGSGLVVTTDGCSSASGSRLVLAEDHLMPCQHWRFERTSGLEFIISVRAGNHVMNVPQPAFEEGTPLEAAIYSGIASHYWSVRDTSVSIQGKDPQYFMTGGLEVFPNPPTGNMFRIRMGQPGLRVRSVKLFSMEGREAGCTWTGTDRFIEVRHSLPPGTYSLVVGTDHRHYHEKFIVPQ